MINPGCFASMITIFLPTEVGQGKGVTYVPLHLPKCLGNSLKLPFWGGRCATDSYRVTFCEPLRVYLVYRLDVV